MSCYPRVVLPNSYEQLTGTSRLQILSSALLYSNPSTTTTTSPNPVPPSATTNIQLSLRRTLTGSAYIAYKKAQVLAHSRDGHRPPQTSIIANMQTFQANQCVLQGRT